ncbi:MAG: DUF6171 family protein [Lachnospiraceae bacterium]|nr:DUF6171 family protein [Lachnospiraceae bacterium]
MSHTRKKDIRTCKQCLLRDFDKALYEEQIRVYIDRLSDSDKADAAEYEKRLSLCKACESLLEGTCLKCGCYVELRAAGKRGRCPAKKW